MRGLLNTLLRPRHGSRRNELRAERVTVTLAVAALATAGTLIAGEVLRMARRREESRQAATPDSLVDAAGLATRDVRIGGRHIHHFVPGIVLALTSGGAALMTRSEGLEAALAVPFGAGAGLTLDEAALLLDLRDVYWTREGILSVQVSLGVTATLAAVILALRVLRRGEEKGAEEGLIPTTSEQRLASTGALA